MIFIGAHDLGRIEAAAEAAYPAECCGLLAGRDGEAGNAVTVTRVVAAANVTEGDARLGFEVDPQVRIDLMRTLRGSEERLVGSYHSHPKGGAAPSETDLARAWEPDLVWLITGMDRGRAAKTRAFGINPQTGVFTETPIHVSPETDR